MMLSIRQEATESEISPGISVIHLFRILLFLKWRDEEPLEDVAREGAEAFCNPVGKIWINLSTPF